MTVICIRIRVTYAVHKGVGEYGGARVARKMTSIFPRVFIILIFQILNKRDENEVCDLFHSSHFLLFSDN